MDQQTAQYALQFMQRVELRGAEVAAWQQVVEALQKLLTLQDAPVQAQASDAN